MSDLKIAVLGAGVVGLTTILELKKQFRNASLQLIADQFYDDTTSFVAAGLFCFPSENFGKTDEITRKWVEDSYSHWDSIRISPGRDAGVKEISGYILAKEDPNFVKNKYIEEIASVYRPMRDDELELFPGNWRYGTYHSNLLMEPKFYLKYALNEIENQDIEIKRKRIFSFDELNNYDVIVNCTGLGSRTLCNDSKIVALRGQVAKVEAPWIKNFVFTENDTYIIPNFGDITLGGCKQYESYNRKFSKLDYLGIKQECEKLIPSLKDAKLLGHRVGLRPHRIPVRVEKEYRNVGGKVLKIVHNYGHGGFGITTAPGTALNAVELVKEVLVEKKSKL